MPKNKPLSKLEWLKWFKAVQEAEAKNQPQERGRLLTAGKLRILAATLAASHQDYLDTGNPLHLLYGFVNARRAGVPVPEWVLEKFTAAIEEVLKSQGKMTLDAALGLVPKRGKRTRWTEQEQHLYDARLKWLFDWQLKEEKLPLVSTKGGPFAVEAVAKLLGYGEKTYDSLRRTFDKRIKKHSSRLSR